MGLFPSLIADPSQQKLSHDTTNMVRAKKVVNDRFRQTKLDWSAAGKSMRKPEAENEKKAVELK